MQNVREAAWVVGACLACAFATFMACFAIVALGYWALALIGLA